MMDEMLAEDLLHVPTSFRYLAALLQDAFDETVQKTEAGYFDWKAQEADEMIVKVRQASS